MTQLTGIVTILQVEQKNGTSAKGPWTLYKVKASDGRTYDTFDAPVAQRASQTGGAGVILEFEERVNGQYTNYDLKDVKSAGAQAQTVVPVGVPATVAIPVEGASTAAQQKDAKITRLAAHKSAASLIGHLYSGSGSVPDVIGPFRQLVEELVLHAETGNWATSATVHPGQLQVAVPEQPVAAQQSDDIPWPA